MASSTNQSFTRAKKAKVNGPLTSNVISIIVGDNNTNFNIHVDKLSATQFFEVEKIIPEVSANQTIFTEYKSDNPETEGSRLFFEETAEDCHTNFSPCTYPNTGAQSYKLSGKHHRPAAFNIFVEWLYNDPPKPIRAWVDIKPLLQAYALALRYKAYPLQNLIIERFRQYHAKTSIKFSNLIWLANHSGEKAGEERSPCPLLLYFIQQVAYEIAVGGFDEFSRENVDLNTFLAESDLWRTRLALFKAIAKCSQASKSLLNDPAKGLSLLRVVESGEEAGGLKRDFIELRDDEIPTKRRNRGH